MSFSERFGYTKPQADLAEADEPPSLVNGLWDALRILFFQNPAKYDILGSVEGWNEAFRQKCTSIWFHFYKDSLDEMPGNPLVARDVLRNKFYKCEFYKKYDFLEFMVGTCEEFRKQEVTIFINSILERERAAFRFAGELLVRITDDTSLEEITSAILVNDSTAVRLHLSRAAELYSQRPEPDYRNSIKESVSAVESAIQYLVGEKSYGVQRPLKAVADKLDLHPALSQGFEKLYAYTSDSNGIRHGILEKSTILQEDARYMLVACSAFANFLVAKKARLSPEKDI